MRIVLCLLLALPCFASAQINKSANEVAREVTRDYIVQKVFKGKAYEPVWYGELIPVKDKKTQTAWTLEHHFLVDERPSGGFEVGPAKKVSYSFLFFLDKRMRVLKAESFVKGE